LAPVAKIIFFLAADKRRFTQIKSDVNFGFAVTLAALEFWFDRRSGDGVYRAVEFFDLFSAS
jgi:hypothetical protein